MIYLNGKFVVPADAKIETNDRGFLLSDGLFETMRSYEGKVFQLKEHFQRLKNGAEFLEIPITFSLSELEGIVAELLQKNGLADKDASLRLTITRGAGPRGLLPPKEPKPTILLAAFLLQAHVAPPVKTHITTIGRNERSPLANIQSLSYLDNILARREAVKNDAEEGILLNSKGNVAEASAANIFMVSQEGVVMTPKLEDGALPGITRQVVIDLCKQLNFPIQEITISPEILLGAKEVFLTNSLTEIQPVISVNRQVFVLKAGSITEQLQTAYNGVVKKTLFFSNTNSENQFNGRLFVDGKKTPVEKTDDASSKLTQNFKS
jgi:branched-chain amino acid aminotransferase